MLNKASPAKKRATPKKSVKKSVTKKTKAIQKKSPAKKTSPKKSASPAKKSATKSKLGASKDMWDYFELDAKYKKL